MATTSASGQYLSFFLPCDGQVQPPNLAFRAEASAKTVVERTRRRTTMGIDKLINVVVTIML
jgi:hypothetical protein